MTTLPPAAPSFQVTEIDGYRIEFHFSTEAAVQEKIRQRPAWAHSWLRAEHISGDLQTTQRLE